MVSTDASRRSLPVTILGGVVLVAVAACAGVAQSDAAKSDRARIARHADDGYAELIGGAGVISAWRGWRRCNTAATPTTTATATTGAGDHGKQ